MIRRLAVASLVAKYRGHLIGIVLSHESEQVFDPLTIRLPFGHPRSTPRGSPQFEVLWAVISPLAIAVMHMLERLQRPAEQFFHH